MLELGCGAGVPVTQMLNRSEKVAEVVANDISERQIELARERVAHEEQGKKISFVQGDMLSLNLEKGNFDGVLAFFSLFHLARHEQPKMLGRIYECLKPGALLVCNFGTEERDIVNEDFFGEKMWWSGWGIEGSLEMLRSVPGGGFEVLESEVLDGFDAGEEVEQGKEEEDAKDPDFGVEFLWVVARKPLEQ